MASRQIFDLRLPGARSLRLGERTLVMGILNLTPDSFADGGRYADVEHAVEGGVQMVQDGADLLDVGGESTRPGAAPVSADEEHDRVIPVLRELSRRVDVPISVDTYRAAVARSALAEGATIVNDISGLRYDPAITSVVADAGAGLVIMHNRGRSKEMYREATYRDVPREVADELGERLGVAVEAGVARESILLDPGLGFAKQAVHSVMALARLDVLATLGHPLVVGPSRKSFLTAALGDVPPSERGWGTAAAVTAAVMRGAHVVRVHDVAEMVDVVRVADLLRKHTEDPGQRIASDG